jgi:dTMP kinase
MDRQEIAFHRRVREGYLQMVAAEPERWVVIEAAQPADVAQQAIRAKVEAKLPVLQ